MRKSNQWVSQRDEEGDGSEFCADGMKATLGPTAAKIIRRRQSGLTREAVVDQHGFIWKARAAIPGWLGLLAHGDNETDHVVGGEIDEFADSIGIETNHRAGVVAHIVSGEHESHAGEPGRTDTLVADEALFALIKWGGHGPENILNGLRSVAPDLLRVDIVRVEVGTHDEDDTGVTDLRLIPGDGPKLSLERFVLHRHEAVVRGLGGLNAERQMRAGLEAHPYLSGRH